MQFDSVAAMINMQGHGPFVWSAYAITFVVLLWLVFSPMFKNRRFFVEQSMRLRREQVRSETDTPS